MAMQSSYTMGELVQSLWDRHSEEAHPTGWRLTLHHPEHGLLITEDIDWFLVRRVTFIPETDRSVLPSAAPQPALEMLFHIHGDNTWTPIALSHTVPETVRTNAPEWLPSTDTADQTQLAIMADRWAAQLEAQQWQTKAHKIPSGQAKPLPTTHAWQPDGITIREWVQTIAETETIDDRLAALCGACEEAGITLA